MQCATKGLARQVALRLIELLIAQLKHMHDEHDDEEEDCYDNDADHDDDGDDDDHDDDHDGDDYITKNLP